MSSPIRLAYAALAFTALSAVVVLGLIWRVGVRIEHELAEFGSALAAPTQAAFDFRVALSVVVGAVLLLAVLLHRHRHAVPFLVLLGLLQLTIGAAYGFALWLPYRAPHAVIK